MCPRPFISWHAPSQGAASMVFSGGYESNSCFTPSSWHWATSLPLFRCRPRGVEEAQTSSIQSNINEEMTNYLSDYYLNSDEKMRMTGIGIHLHHFTLPGTCALCMQKIIRVTDICSKIIKLFSLYCIDFSYCQQFKGSIYHTNKQNNSITIYKRVGICPRAFERQTILFSHVTLLAVCVWTQWPSIINFFLLAVYKAFSCVRMLYKTLPKWLRHVSHMWYEINEYIIITV